MYQTRVSTARGKNFIMCLMRKAFTLRWDKAPTALRFLLDAYRTQRKQTDTTQSELISALLLKKLSFIHTL